MHYTSDVLPALFSVVVPAYNEASGIGSCIDRMRAHLETLGVLWELVIVDDGSADATAARVEELAARDPRIRLVRGDHRGKGAAVRTGMLAARGDWRFMADADLSMPPDNLDRFLRVIRQHRPPDVVIGSREAAGARRVGEPWTRHAIGRVFNWIAQLVAVPGIRDTQCGYKLFSGESAAVLFHHQTLEGFAFDVELLLLARRARFRVAEIGIVWNCRTDSRVGIARGIAAFGQLLRIRWNAWTGRYAALPRANPPEVNGLRNASS